MKQRIFSTLGLWLVVGLLAYFGGPVAVAIVIALVAGLTQREFHNLMQRSGVPAFTGLGVGLGALITLGAYFSAFNPGELLAGTAILLTLIVIYRSRDPQDFPSLTGTLLGLIFIPFTFSFFNLMLATMPGSSGILVIIWIIAVSKFADVGALLVGKAVGKHKFALAISPGKTWEGVVGGLATAVVVGIVLSAAFGGYVEAILPPLKAGLIALPVAICSITSDLLESAIKRLARIKDSGNSIPGIGGIFDLTDSFVLAAPMAWLCLQLF